MPRKPQPPVSGDVPLPPTPLDSTQLEDEPKLFAELVSLVSD